MLLQEGQQAPPRQRMWWAKYAMLGVLPAVALVVLIITLANGSTAPPPPPPPPPPPSPSSAPPPTTTGTAATTTVAQREAALRGSVAASALRADLRALTARPHVAGSAGDWATAQLVRDRLAALPGAPFRVRVVRHPVLLSTPSEGGGTALRVRHVPPRYASNSNSNSSSSSSSSTTYDAVLVEEPLAEDPSSQPGLGAPAQFNGYSASGAALDACVVYANFARREDFEALAAAGVRVRGCVVLARYGRIFRGNKARLCEEHGCAGLLIYSDPAEDGFVRGPTYPSGKWRPASSAQRGSVWTGDGDPLTPGWPSTPDAPHLDQDLASDHDAMKGDPLPTIPIMPLAWRDAQPILAGLCPSTPLPDSSWQGAVPDNGAANGNACDPPSECATPLAYCLGGEAAPVRVDFTVAMNITVRDIWNVIAVMDGESSRAVVMGNHRDAWCFGAVDPSSGTSVLLATARALAAVKQADPSWRPRRTIVLASWDAEEHGLVGSYEWGEQFSTFVQAQVVAYINVDIGVSGGLGFVARGTPQLKKFMFDVARDVEMAPATSNPPGPTNAYDSWMQYTRAVRQDPAASEPMFNHIGAGTDFLVFLQRLGVSSVDARFDDDWSGTSYAVYHSNYDSFTWMERYGDPTFERHVVTTRVLSLALLRMADQADLPHNWTEYAEALTTAANSAAGYVAQRGITAPGMVDFAPLHSAIADLRAAAAAAAQDVASAAAAAAADDRNPSLAIRLADANDRLMLAERALIRDQGLPGRPFIRHAVFAPSAVDSYAGVAFAGITDASYNTSAPVADRAKLVQSEIQMATLHVRAAAQVLTGSIV